MDKDILGDIQSSPEIINTFLKSIVYQDFLNEIQLRIAETTVMLDDFDTNFSGRQYDTFRGRKRNLLEMLELFQDMYENKLDDLELEEGESDE